MKRRVYKVYEKILREGVSERNIWSFTTFINNNCFLLIGTIVFGVSKFFYTEQKKNKKFLKTDHTKIYYLKVVRKRNVYKAGVFLGYREEGNREWEML